MQRRVHEAWSDGDEATDSDSDAMMLPVLAPSSSLGVDALAVSLDRENAKKPSEEDEEHASTSIEIDRAYLWTLLLATLAECVTTCFVPDWFTPAWKLNVTATVINLIGPLLDGMSCGYELDAKGKVKTKRKPFLEFRAAFLGVFTSYSYMVDHAGDLSAPSQFYGVVYIALSIAGACVCFAFGRMMMRHSKAKRALRHVMRMKLLRKTPSFVSASLIIIALTLMRAVFGKPGFVRDPNDPQFINQIRVADGEELVLGIFMSCTGILVSDYLEYRFTLQPSKQETVSMIDWGNLVCNFVACWLTCLAYEASKLSPGEVTNNLLVMKFVSSFCGSISNFSGAILQIMTRWDAGNRAGAYWNLGLHILTGLIFLPYLRK